LPLHWQIFSQLSIIWPNFQAAPIAEKALCRVIRRTAALAGEHGTAFKWHVFKALQVKASWCVGIRFGSPSSSRMLSCTPKTRIANLDPLTIFVD